MTLPSSVNFSALPTRLMMTCRNRSSSPISEAGRLGASSSKSSRRFCLACEPMLRTASRMTAAGVKGARRSSSVPDLPFEKLSTSLTISKRLFADVLMVPITSRISGSALSGSSCTMPMMPVSGVRSS